MNLGRGSLLTQVEHPAQRPKLTVDGGVACLLLLPLPRIRADVGSCQCGSVNTLEHQLHVAVPLPRQPLGRVRTATDLVMVVKPAVQLLDSCGFGTHFKRFPTIHLRQTAVQESLSLMFIRQPCVLANLHLAPYLGVVFVVGDSPRPAVGFPEKRTAAPYPLAIFLAHFSSFLFAKETKPLRTNRAR